MANAKLWDYGVAPGQFTATVRQGSSGTAVRAVQFYLRRLAAYYSDVPTVTVDGTFGAATTRAVRAWQERAGPDRGRYRRPPDLAEHLRRCAGL